MDIQSIIAALEVLLRIFQVLVVPGLGVLVSVLLAQRKKITELEQRLTRAEVCLASVPSEKVMHELDLSIRDFGGNLHVAVEKIEGLRGIVERVERVVSRHEDFLLNGGK